MLQILISVDPVTANLLSGLMATQYIQTASLSVSFIFSFPSLMSHILTVLSAEALMISFESELTAIEKTMSECPEKIMVSWF